MARDKGTSSTIPPTAEGAPGRTRLPLGAFLLQKLRADRCFFLMLSLLGLLVSYHWLRHYPVFGLMANIVLLTTGLWAVSQSRVRTLTVGSLGAMHVALAITAMQTKWATVEFLAAAFLLAFQACTMLMVLHYVVRGRRVTTDKLFGVVSVYLLIGFSFSSAYTLVYICQPDAFGVGKEAAREVDLIYFSFVTLCSIGYGDVAPAPGLARALAVLEGVIGVFYIAILVSRLMNMFQEEQDEEREEEGWEALERQGPPEVPKAPEAGGRPAR